MRASSMRSTVGRGRRLCAARPGGGYSTRRISIAPWPCGAAHYGVARRGRGIRIRSGAARHLLRRHRERDAGRAGSRRAPCSALCVVPFGMEEGAEAAIPAREFGLVVGEPAEFRFLSSTVRKQDAVGDLVDEWDDEIEELDAIGSDARAPGPRWLGRARRPREPGHRSGDPRAVARRAPRRRAVEARMEHSRAALTSSRFVIGIDLGTTNSAVAWADLHEAERGEPLRVQRFPIPPVVGPGETAASDTLPSFLYLAPPEEREAERLVPPWEHADAPVVGRWARDRGMQVPGRLVSSAKSWLLHDTVDRRARLLPWSADPAERQVSPVEASAAYLRHIRASWDHAHGGATGTRFEDQAIVLTVPASFDEEARELTIEAARSAGYRALHADRRASRCAVRLDRGAPRSARSPALARPARARLRCRRRHDRLHAGRGACRRRRGVVRASRASASICSSAATTSISASRAWSKKSSACPGSRSPTPGPPPPVRRRQGTFARASRRRERPMSRCSGRDGRSWAAP